MKQNKVVITGHKGSIGRILFSGLNPLYDVIGLDSKPGDLDNEHVCNILHDTKKLAMYFEGADIVIHLAWDMREDYPKEVIIPENKLMVENVLAMAQTRKVRRVIMASSVHANRYPAEDGSKLDLNEFPTPDSPYGASKVYIESLSKYYAYKYGMDVICIRFGGVNESNKILFEEDPAYDKVFLSREDCLDLVRTCIDVPEVPHHFGLVYGISDNEETIHQKKNFLNWHPRSYE